MTNRTRRTLRNRTRLRPPPHTRCNKIDGIVILGQKRRDQGQHKLQKHKNLACNMRTRKAQLPLRKFKSPRMRSKGHYKRFLDKGDELEVVVEHCAKESSYGDEYEDNDDVDNDADSSDDTRIWKNANHDGDWTPKSCKKNRIHNDGEDDVRIISGQYEHGVIARRARNLSNDINDDDSNDTNDHDGFVPSRRTRDVDSTPGKIDSDWYCHNDDDDDPDATPAHGYFKSVDESLIHIDDDLPPTDNVGYVKRKRRSVHSLLKGFNKRGLLQGSTSASHIARLNSLWSKEAVLPSWGNKKPRVIICKKQDKAFTYAGRCDVQVHHKLDMAVQQTQQHTNCNTMHTPPTCQQERPHVTGMSSGEPPLPTHSNSPDVLLREVLEQLPKDSTESELTSSLHGDDASINQHLNTTNSAKRPSSGHTQEEMAEDRTGKEKSQAPMGKPKRKKHRPKVQRDISRKVKCIPRDNRAKSTPRNVKKKAPAQGADGVQTEKPKQVQNKLKKRQEASDSTMESSTMSKKPCGRKQRRASPALKDNNLGTKCFYTFNRESSLIPFQSTNLHIDQDSQESSLQYLTVREAACLHKLLAIKAELGIYKHMATFAPELIDCIQRNKPDLYGQFLGQQVPHQFLGLQVPCFTFESQLAPPLKSREELQIGFNNLSLVDSKAESFTQPLLTQEPHNQLKMVVYNQKKEMVISKSTKSRVKIRAKVHLDAENERMWPLLVLGGIPTDFEDVLYWEKERAIMKKHVSLFIHNMQAVQGDRHFSPWKGSILDSVVGAFLTQNVSDHLSSSAFMSVAARYPSKQRSSTENTNLLDTTLNGENKSALELSTMSYQIQSDTQVMYETSSGSVVASSRQLENENVPNLEGSGKITSSCETTECKEQKNSCFSLRGVKSILRNGASQIIEMKHKDNKSNLVTPTAFADEKCVGKSGVQPLDGTFKEKTLLEQRENSSSNLDHTSSRPVDYTGQRTMHHLGRNPTHLMEGNVLIESSARVNNENNITDDYTGQSGSEHASLHLLTAEDDTTNEPRSSHKGRTADCTGQGGIQNSEEASSWLDISMKLCSNSILHLGHHDGTSANHTGLSGMGCQENPSQSLMEKGVANKPSGISTFNLSPYHYRGQVGLQHLDRAFPCSVGEHISVNLNDPNGKSTSEKQDPCNCDNSCAERLDKEKLCSLPCTKMSCDHESVSSALKTRETVYSNDTNTHLQDAEPSIAESLAFEQCTTNGSWSSPDPRTEVYSKMTVCRSLFQNHDSVQINSSTTTLIDYNNNEQASINSDTSHTENHLAVIQESRQMACGSKIVHDVEASSPVSTIVGNKRRHALSGLERAHLEENQYGRKKSHTQDWESMRRQTLESCSSNEKACKENLRKDAYQDSVNWDAVRRAPVEELAETIKERGMHHVLSGRIKALLNTLHEEQGDLDLEWLRKISPENAKAYLTNIRGLGVKSVECIRLLTLHHVAFPVDVNVGRICVRLGWVPIEPLPEELQLHLLELYPVQETIQKFLWNRLWMLDQKTLYELHYQLITFGKVFCTKSKPNCNACPMRTNCKHFASAYASAKLLLTGPENEPSKRLCSGTLIPAITNSPSNMESKTMVENVEGELASQALEKDFSMTTFWSKCQQYFVEEPASPEETYELELGEEINDIEDFPYIYGSLNDFTEDLLEVSELPYKSMNGYSNYTHKEVDKKWEQDNNSVDTGIDTLHIITTGSSSIKDRFSADCTLTTTRASSSDYNSNNPSYNISTQYESIDEGTASDINADVNQGATSALVSLPEGAYIPAPKLKNIDRLRTVHYVYELPDDHPLLEHAEIRDTDDPSFYLLAIWSPGEAPDSLSGMGEDRQEDLCRFSATTNANETVSGTLLIPCRTAMRGSFPLNGTYFQVNEVFADHESSLRPFQVPRSHIWRLQRRFVYFGTSVSNIFRGLTLDEIKNCFLQGYVCVRGFDRKYKTPRPLVCRLHFPISKQIQQHKKEETEASYKSRTI